MPECDYLRTKYKHGYTVTVGQIHADGSVRLAREIPYGSLAWKERYNRRNSAESRNSVWGSPQKLYHLRLCVL